MSLGICLPWQLAERDASYYTRTRHALGWPVWMNWKYDCTGMDGYTPMLWSVRHGVHMTRAMEIAQTHPRQTWLLGNEPERVEQSNTSPAEFADAMRTWLALVGGQWAGPGILWGDEGRAWIDEYLRIGGPVPDYWAIHVYGSSDMQGWGDQYNHAFHWLRERGVRDIWVTETNLHADVAGNATLLCYLVSHPEIVAYWFASHAIDANRVANLHEADGRLTHLGRVFRELQGAHGAQREHNHYFPFLPG